MIFETAEEIDRLVAACREGLSIPVLAERFNCSADTIKAWRRMLIRAGVKMPRPNTQSMVIQNYLKTKQEASDVAGD